jgi:hypothetical protein
MFHIDKLKCAMLMFTFEISSKANSKLSNIKTPHVFASHHRCLTPRTNSPQLTLSLQHQGHHSKHEIGCPARLVDKLTPSLKVHQPCSVQQAQAVLVTHATSSTMHRWLGFGWPLDDAIKFIHKGMTVTWRERKQFRNSDSDTEGG